MGRRRSLGGLSTPLAVLWVGRIMHSTLLCTSEVDLGLWPLCIFFFLIAPTAHAFSYFQQLLVSLFSVAPRDVCPRASTPVKKGSKVPANLTGICPHRTLIPEGEMDQSPDSDMSEGGGAGVADAHAAVAAQNCLLLSGGQGRLPGGDHIQRETSVMNRSKPAKVRGRMGNRISGRGNSMCQDTFSPGPLFPPRYVAFSLLF